VNDEPLSLSEAVKEKKWVQAMEAEMHTIEKNYTWELTTLPSGHQAIGEQWENKARSEKC